MISYIGKSLDDYLYNKPLISKYIQALGIKPEVMYEYDNYKVLSSSKKEGYSLVVSDDNLVGVFCGLLDEIDINDIYHKYLTGKLAYPLQGCTLKDVESAYSSVNMDDSYNTNDEQIIAISSYFEIINQMTISYLEYLNKDNRYVDYYVYIKSMLNVISLTIENSLLYDQEIVIERLLADCNLSSSSYFDLLNIVNGFEDKIYSEDSLFDNTVKKLIRN